MWGDIVFPKEEWSLEKLKHLFNSERWIGLRGDLLAYSELQSMIEDGIINITCFNLYTTKPPLQPKRKELITPEWNLFRKAGRKGGDLHGWLKWWSYNYLLAIDGSNPMFEVILNHVDITNKSKSYGIADVYCSTYKYIIECSNTSPRHTINALQTGLAKQFIVLPFQRIMLENIPVPKSSFPSRLIVLRYHQKTKMMPPQ